MQDYEDQSNELSHEDAELLAKGLTVQKMLSDIMEAKKFFVVDPDLFVEGWLKTHIYGAKEDWLEEVKQLFSENFIKVIHKINKEKNG